MEPQTLEVWKMNFPFSISKQTHTHKKHVEKYKVDPNTQKDDG